MKFGVNTLIWTGGFSRANLDLLPRVKEHGFDGIEVASFDFNGFPAAEVRREAERCGLDVLVCTALTGNQSLGTEDAKVRADTRAFLIQAIEAAAEMGAGVMAGPFCSAVGYLPGRRRTEDEWKRAVEGLQSLGDTLDRCGVSLAVEALNRFETFFLNTAADNARLCDEVGHPRVGILYDTFHAHIEEKDQGEAIRTAGKHIIHMHTCENDRGTPGSGQVHWDKVFAAVRDIGYDRYMVIESFGANIKEIAAAACIWRDLAAKSEDIGWEGVKYLKAACA